MNQRKTEHGPVVFDAAVIGHLKAVQVESYRQRNALVALAADYHKTELANIASLVAEYRALVPDLPRAEQDVWWNRLVVAAGEIERLEIEVLHDWSHLARRAAAAELPHARDELKRAAHFALMADATAALLKARAAQ